MDEGHMDVCSICGYPFDEFKSRKQKIVPDAPVSHY